MVKGRIHKEKSVKNFWHLVFCFEVYKVRTNWKKEKVGKSTIIVGDFHTYYKSKSSGKKDREDLNNTDNKLSRLIYIKLCFQQRIYIISNGTSKINKYWPHARLQRKCQQSAKIGYQT